MRIGRTIPPAASPIYFYDIVNGFRGMIRGSREIERFEAELKDYFGVKHVFMVSSGKAALTLILRALRELHPDRSEVLIPAFCCFSVPSAIIRAGLKVRLCDVDSDTLDFNHDELEQILAKYSHDSRNVISATNASIAINPTNPTNQNNSKYKTNINKTGNGRRTTDHKHADRKLLAIIPVHLFGLSANVDRVKNLVNDPSVSILEDAAQVMGAEKSNRKLGTIGDVGFFSLGRGKALSAVDGGIIVTNRDDIAKLLQKQVPVLKGYKPLELFALIFKSLTMLVFQYPTFFWIPKALPFLKIGGTFYDPNFPIRSLSNFQAGLTRRWKEKLSKFTNIRQESVGFWVSRKKEFFSNVYDSNNGNRANFIRYPVKLTDTKSWEKVLQNSEREGLGIMLTYPSAISEIPEIKKNLAAKWYPGAEALSKTLLTLPVHPLLTGKDKIKIHNSLSKFHFISKYPFTINNQPRTTNTGKAG